MNDTYIEYIVNPDGSRGKNWPIITGCLHPCRNEYCYNTMKNSSVLNRFYKENRAKETGNCHAAKQGEMYPCGFDPTFYPHRLLEPAKTRKPCSIFVANGGDCFGDWIPSLWICAITTVVEETPQHTYYFLTKNPQRYNLMVNFPKNALYGTSVTRQSEVHDRLKWLDLIKGRKWVSVEPLLEYINPATIFMHDIDWIVVGALTGKGTEKNNVTQKEWVMDIVEEARIKNVPVFMKNNLKYDKSVQMLPNDRYYF